MDSVRVRFAPSPTGFLHLGVARTALFNWLFARARGGTCILRVDDTDDARSTEESMRSIFGSLEWLGLDWDEGPGFGGDSGPYFQGQRVERHQECARQLLDEGKAYYCYCTREEIQAKREQAQGEKRPYRYDGRCRDLTEADRARFETEGRTRTVRFNVGDSGRIVVKDLVLGDVAVEADTLDDFIFMRPNFSPLYNFTSPVDDADMGITHVIRGQDHMSNTPRQILLCEALGWTPPAFAHIPMVHNLKGQKLSKRDGAVGVEDYRDMGFLPEAMVNYLARLAWSGEDEQEIFSVQELTDQFTLERVGKSPSRFDIQKLTWLNAHYVGLKSVSERAAAVTPFLVEAGHAVDAVAPGRMERIVDAVGDRLHTYADIVTYAGYFFADDDAYEFDPAALKKWFKGPEALAVVTDVRAAIAGIDPFDLATIEEVMREWIEQRGEKVIRVLQPIRVAVTGKMVGPGLFDVLELLGKEVVLARLDRAAAELPELTT
ncbi:glutamate--tRNA ligase [Candidatus Poribacteria bacterium]|nr:glutamate--tRNA ligase [Candidatus Poribacteria bacterium]MBT5533288.1 glutamate--tRNA ligase [Candidatus Poribacteria bacterium]MBT5713945.1 glutamate--tRNA ligase [Candidatus Poribacteria bacterium]MBT7097392.1 glutamate--tRNA ligase [Candidatus Poribacteria bacterium]MBT7804593.1 glutamate--tRNA ligase [Candidatus Poribacteria bacterium]